MFVYGGQRSGSGSRRPEEPPSPEISAEGQRFELALLVAGLPACGRFGTSGSRPCAHASHPAWQEEDVGEAAAEQCRDWWHPLVEGRLRQQTPRGLLLMQTELEGGLRSMATPLWLLNRMVRRVWLLHQGQRGARRIERWSGCLRMARWCWRG